MKSPRVLRLTAESFAARFCPLETPKQIAVRDETYWVPNDINDWRRDYPIGSEQRFRVDGKFGYSGDPLPFTKEVFFLCRRYVGAEFGAEFRTVKIVGVDSSSAFDVAARITLLAKEQKALVVKSTVLITTGDRPPYMEILRA